jgi:hypothetical protein
VAIVYNLYRIIGYINVYIDSKLFKVNVPLISCGIVGFTPPRDGY